MTAAPRTDVTDTRGGDRIQHGTLAHKTLGPWNLTMTKLAVPPRIRE